MPDEANDQTLSQHLKAVDAGERIDLNVLLDLVYDQLRRIAKRQLEQERSGHTLQATALVHEAFLKLADAESLGWKSKGHFYAAAAEAMRRILIDHARARGSKKRGGGAQRVAVSLADLVSEADPQRFLAVDDALSRLKEVEPRAGSVAHLRLFAGLSVAETAAALEIPLRTVERDWAYARTWLYERLK
ncbi:MAG: sigma-70 family RNA polymerase sigma factor [Planctomycetes bacterium]|nr:sigma-70 family RNA polymerase sigma factor [Planctomycetota bacterium]